MAIRKSSNSGIPFGNTANRPSSPQVGQTYYNGTLGYLEIYTDAGWIPATGANDFSLNITGTHTEVTFNQSYSSGSYSIVSFLNDATLDIYAFATDGSAAGYTKTKAFTATQRFNKMVVIGGSAGDVLQFSYKTTYATIASTTSTTAGPYISEVTPSGMPNQDDTITITGGNFATDVEVVFTGTGYSPTAPKSIVRSSSTQLIVTRPDNFPTSGSPYTVTVTNPSVANQPTGSASHIYSGITSGSIPVWQTSTTLSNAEYGVAYSQTLSATDADGGSTITYSVISGSIPTGLSFDTSTGVISGTPTQATPQSVSYAIRATDSGGNTADRTFTFTYSPISGGITVSDSTYYYKVFTGSSNFVTSMDLTADVLMIAGGASGGSSFGGGGGAGGVIYSASKSITSGTYPLEVGAGGASTAAANNIRGYSGTNTTGFGWIALGGGGGGSYDNTYTGNPGGSGGGGSASEVVGTKLGGAATQTSGSGYTGYGNRGGNTFGGGPYISTGGGGAGAPGQDISSGTTAGNGGNGLNTWSSWLTAISSAMTGVSGWSTATSGGYIAGGGAGASYQYANGSVPGQPGAGGGGTSTGAQNGAGGAAKQSTGSGGGGGGYPGGVSGSGGSGLVIIRYTKAQVGE